MRRQLRDVSMEKHLTTEERKGSDVLALIQEIKGMWSEKEIGRRIMDFKKNNGDIRWLKTCLDYEIYDVQHHSDFEIHDPKNYMGLTDEATLKEIEERLLTAKKICEEVEKPQILK
jgi:hypothetical protein